jgi:hypothetical protein
MYDSQSVGRAWGDIAPRAYGAAQEAAGEPKIGEQGAASFRTDAVRLARQYSHFHALLLQHLVKAGDVDARQLP